MKMNYVNLVAAWKAGKITLAEAANYASKLEAAVRKVDPDGTVWYEGDENNSSVALEAFYDYDTVHEFLNALAKN